MQNELLNGWKAIKKFNNYYFSDIFSLSLKNISKMGVGFFLITSCVSLPLLSCLDTSGYMSEEDMGVI